MVDVSASIGPGPLAPPSGVRIDPRWVAVAETVREVDGRAAAPGLAREGTRLGAALRWVAAHHPGRDSWVFTDGRATDGDVEAAARGVAAAGGRVHVTAPVRPAADVALLEARVRGGAGRANEVRAVVGSSTTGCARVILAREGRTLATRDVGIEPGVRVEVVLEDDEAPPTGATYTVSLEPGEGTPNDDPANDRLTVGLPPTRPSVLVWGDLAVGDWAAPSRPFLLRHMVSFEAGSLDTADCVVLCSLPWRRIGDVRVRDLVRFVSGGGRLLVLGGPHSWRAGGWAGTPLEDDLTGLRVPRTEGPGLALVLALDRSGSTARGAIVDLLDAVRGAVADLAPGERLAVLPFAALPADDLLPPGWLSTDDEARAVGELEQSLARLVPGGGTDLAAGVLAAARRAAAAPARSHRVLLLTDGDPDHRVDEAALEALRRELDLLDVEFGAVVSGMPEVARRLRDLVARRPDAVVLLEDTSGIPQCLLHELARLRREAELLPAPDEIRGTADFAALRPGCLQALERSPEGRVVAEALWADGSPPPAVFAARRAVGAGEVLALAWGPEFEPRPQVAGAWLTPVLASLAREADRGLTAHLEGPYLVVPVPQARGAGRIRFVGEDVEGDLLEVMPALFRGRLPDPVPTGLRVRLPSPPGEGPRERPLRLPARPALEHQGAGVSESALRALAAAGGGLRLPEGVSPPVGRRPSRPSLAPWLLLLAAILLVLDRAWTEGGGASVRSLSEEEVSA